MKYRRACAVESAAKTNPDRDVFVIFVSPVGYPDDELSPTFDGLQSYPNIHLRNLNFPKLMENTPVEKWCVQLKKISTNRLFVSINE